MLKGRRQRGDEGEGKECKEEEKRTGWWGGVVSTFCVERVVCGC